MRITDYLNEECIDVSLGGKTKNDIIAELAQLIFKQYPAVNHDTALSELMARENLESTAIGKGIAIPHAGITDTDTIYAAAGLIPGGADMDAIDDKPVTLVLLILYPKNNVNLQLRFLARVSRLLHDQSLREELYTCKTPADFHQIFKQYEDRHFH